MCRGNVRSSTEPCPIRHQVVVRIATFNPTVDETELLSGGRWDEQILTAFAQANRIYNRYGIAIFRGHREDLSVEQTHEVLGIVERGYLTEGEFLDNALARGQLHDVEGRTFEITDEVRAMLDINRGPSHQVCSYWVPQASALGKCYHHDEYPEIRGREGVVVTAGVEVDTLAHELGHLLTRAGHVDVDTNLMWEHNHNRREPRELTDPQLDVIRASQYVRRRRRRAG